MERGSGRLVSVCMFESLKHLNHDSMLAGKNEHYLVASLIWMYAVVSLLAPRSSIFSLVNKSISLLLFNLIASIPVFNRLLRKLQQESWKLPKAS